jgi:hypothetical protein
MGTATRSRKRSTSRLLTVIVGIWLVIGFLAAVQRGYLYGNDADCAKIGTIAATVISGPLNYVGANPKIECNVPQPSK